MSTVITEPIRSFEFVVPTPDSLQIKPPVKAALTLLITRNHRLNASHPELQLTEEVTPTLVATAERLVDFQGKLKKQAGDAIAHEFLATPYNITWLEQIVDIDPTRVALAMQTKHRVHDLIEQQGIDRQYEPVLALGVFTGLERIYDLEATNDSTRTVIEKIQAYDRQTPRKNRLHRHLITYLEELPPDRPILTGQQRDEELTRIIVRDMTRKLETHSQHAAILKQSQGIEVEVLQHLDWIEKSQRDTKRKQMQMARVERYGIRDWLPRGIRKEDHERTDWHLTHMLGIPEDISEKKYEYFEMSTAPTEGGPAQSTILYELMLAGFITPEELSNTWEKYSMHAATTFPDTIWHDRAQRQYILHARGLAGAFASVQRGVYGGYVFDDNVGREIADKTIEGGGKFRPVEGKAAETKLGQRLVEMRVLDLTEQGQYAIELHKPYLDFAFRCYWEFANGQPLRNIAEYRAVNVWTKYIDELSTIYERYGITMDTSSNNWRAVGWKKAEDPRLQKDLAALIRTHARELRHIVDAELTHTETLPETVEMPMSILGKRTITRVETADTPLHDPILVLSQQEADRLRLQDGQLFFMRHGEIRKPVFIQIDKTNSQQPTTMGVNAELLQLLHLPEQTTISIRHNPIEQELSCGPVLGITVRLEDPTLQEPFGEQTPYHKSLILAARKQGIEMYSFDVSSGTDNFRTDERIITGITLNEDGTKWIQKDFPFPDAIISRNFGERSKEKIQAISHIPLVNHPDFIDLIADKVELPKAISEHPILRTHVPETIVYTGLRDVEAMLSRNETVYVKPTWGMRSEGVARFDRLPDGRIRYTLPIKGTDPTDLSYSWPERGQPGYGGYIVNTVQEALQMTAPFREQFAYHQYIVQAGIAGIPGHEDDRPLELRFLFQRNADGQPAIIGWNQGQKDYWMPVIRRLFGTSAENIATNATGLATAISLQLQNHFGPQFGQYSIQIAVDRHGKTWLLEANPKPGVTNQFHYLKLDRVVDYSSDEMVRMMTRMSGYAPERTTPRNLDRVTLKDGTTGIISEETNPYVIYEFALRALGKNIRQRETSVYNLKSIQRIQENIANRTRYILLRSENGTPLGCISIIRPKSQQYYDLEIPEHPLNVTKKRWEIGGVLTSPEARGKGVAKQLFDAAIAQIQASPLVHDEYNRTDVREILVNVTGTYNWSKIGIPREDSIGIERIVQSYPGCHPLGGAVPGSLGPIYIIPIAQA